jgi:hypothetical protein
MDMTPLEYQNKQAYHLSILARHETKVEYVASKSISLIALTSENMKMMVFLFDDMFEWRVIRF